MGLHHSIASEKPEQKRGKKVGGWNWGRWSRPRMVPVTITCTFTEWPSAWALAVFLLLPFKRYAFLERYLRLDGGILGCRFWQRGSLGRRRGGGGLNRLIGRRNCLRSAADAGGDGF